MLFTEEVKTMQELIEKLTVLDCGLNKIKVCVVGFIFDEYGNSYLNRRGPGARDEIGKLQALGGSVNEEDENFRASLLRELKEEGGPFMEIRIDSFLGGILNHAKDNHTGQEDDWIILGYKTTLVSGKVINGEPDRSMGIEKSKLSDFPKEELSRTTAIFIDYMLNDKK